MPVLHRVVFGEPKPGFQAFASILGAIDDSVSYCNRGGPMLHDRVMDLPFTIPVLDLDFKHPTDPIFTCGHPATNDDWGIFAYHHMALYWAGMSADAAINPLHLECARLCKAVYAYPGDPVEPWDESLTTDGVAWAVRFDGPRAFVVFRGSYAFLDWLRDIAAFDPERILARITKHDTFGPMWDGFLIGMPETWAAIRPLIANRQEVIFTGHSLGAARADIAAGYALTAA